MVVVPAERACEELLTVLVEELLLEERAWEPLLTEELLPLERVVVPLERVVVLEPLERVACWLLLLLERDTCELLPDERVVCELLLLERDTCELLPDERVVCWLLPLERLELEELLPVERVVVEPPPERDWPNISGAVSMDSAITNDAA